VQVVIQNLSHTYPSDIRLLLVSPSGKVVVLMDNVGSVFGITNQTLIINNFSDNSTSNTPASSFNIDFSSTPGETYIVESTESLQQNDWVTEYEITSTQAQSSATISKPAAARRFFRIRKK